MAKKNICTLIAITLSFILASCAREETVNLPTEESANQETTEQEVALEIEQEEKNTVKENFTTKDGVILNSTFIYAEDKEAVEPYLEAAEYRKNDILNSDTMIVKSDEFIPGETYTGTAYYFSSINGDDHNDGLSPETPFKSIAMYNKICDSLEYGDAVFFERGSLYRLEDVNEWGESHISAKGGVTYSAYGEGDKPVLTKAIENSAYEEAWDLYYEGDSGEKIWRYHLKVQYCGGIIFDDESYASRVMEWPTPDGWLALNEIESDPCHGNVGVYPSTNTTLISAGEYRSIEEALVDNMTYVTRLDLEGCEYPLDFRPGVWDEAWKISHNKPYKSYSGELYLRCDEGNPGALYTDIEIIAASPDNSDLVIDGWNAGGYVLDNLCFKYTMGPVNGWAGGDGIVIQNCVMGWQGSRLHQINSEEPTIDFSLIGDGIYCVARNAIIRNNYMYQMAEGATFEQSQGDWDMGNYTITGNLMEYCGEGVRINWNDIYAFDQIEITDNMILYSGYGFNNNDYEGYFSIDLGWEPYQYAMSLLVENNVCLECKYGLLMLHKNLKTKITDNVFIQNEHDALMLQFGRDGVNWIMMDDLE